MSEDNFQQEVPSLAPVPVLEGVRVIDFSALLPGAVATQILADFGADVIKVERPGGDPMRAMMPGSVAATARGKRSIVLDLKINEDLAAAHALVGGAAVVVEGFRPGVATRLGIDYETLSGLNPNLVYCSLSGYGQTGPRRLEPGHDLNYLALAGAFAAQPRGTVTLLPVGDTLGGAYAAAAILAALHGGSGTYIDLSITEAVLAGMSPLVSEHVARGRPRPEEFPLRPAYGLYPTAEGKMLCVACTENHFWQRACEVLGLERLAADPELGTWEGRAQRAREIDVAIAAAIATRSHTDLVDAFRRADVPITDVSEFEDVLREPQFAARAAIGGANSARFAQPGFPALVGGVRPRAAGSAPEPDQDGASLREEIAEGILDG